jgi:maltokinase
LAEAGRSELLDRSLLRPFEVEQACRELIYAARHLPRWRYAPMGVLRTWF